MRKASRELLFEMLQQPTPSGYEGSVSEVWQRDTARRADRVEVDLHGNAIAVHNPEGQPRVMLAGHMDPLWFQVVQVSDDGYLYFDTIGGFDLSTVPARPVQVQARGGIGLDCHLGHRPSGNGQAQGGGYPPGRGVGHHPGRQHKPGPLRAAQGGGRGELNSPPDRCRPRDGHRCERDPAQPGGRCRRTGERSPALHAHAGPDAVHGGPGQYREAADRIRRWPRRQDRLHLLMQLDGTAGREMGKDRE